jgi:alkanesulfonate monooxygenase SsuD/methylene tetrahydromethanopterin reductase-like flavin-dependent oxidoreductase (luciferase family)
VEVWLHAFSFPRRIAELAREAEEWGFTGLLVADSQNLNADVWIELALAGAVTSRLRIGPGVTNPVTRHLAVTASAAATLQAETAGRAHVAATGPRTIQAAARRAEGVDLTVGAELERLRWAAGIARKAAPGRLTVGAYLNVAVHPDREIARQLVRGSVATFARFATQGAPSGGLSAVTKSGIERLASGYDADHHESNERFAADVLPELIG